MSKLAARGLTLNIVITESTNVTRNVELEPFIGDNATGTFTWNITFPTGITQAAMRIVPLVDGVLLDNETIEIDLLVSNNNADTRELDAGFYRAFIELVKPGAQTLVRRETIHIYNYLESILTLAFTDIHFTNLGTAENPFRVNNLDDLLYVGREGYLGGVLNNAYLNWGLDKHYVLTANITLDETNPNNWTPIGTTTPFTGVFSGNGFTITGLTITGSGNDQGMFGFIGSGGEVENLRLINVDVSGGVWVGGIAGDNAGVIRNCYVAGRISGNSSIGGLVGWNAGTIENSYFDGTVSGDTGSIGGIAGTNVYFVQNSYATGDVTGNIAVGGVAGMNRGTVENSYAIGNINGNGYVGGVVGLNEFDGITGTVKNCFFNGTVTGDFDVGGIVGYNPGFVEFCYAVGIVIGNNIGNDYGVGGIVGDGGQGTVQNCIALNQSVIVGNATQNIGRVIGRGSERVNNRAWADMDIRHSVTIPGSGTPVNTGNALDHWDGLGITAAQAKTRAAWETGAGFDFSPSGSWVWEDGKMPRLKNQSVALDWPVWFVDPLVTVSGFTTGDPIRDFDDLADALNSITTAGTYTVTVRAPQNLAGRTIGAGQNITIEGAAQITLNNATQRMFTVNAGGNLTIGGDITLNGHSSNSGSLILVQNGTLTVRDNAIITGHTTTHAAGAIDITENSTMNINGGSITGNSPLDALATGTVNISGTAQIGNFTLNIHEAHRGSAAVNAAFDGSVASLNLRRNVAIMNDVVNSWQSQQVISGTFASAAISAGKFGLGNFVSTNNTQPIDETHFINASGMLIRENFIVNNFTELESAITAYTTATANMAIIVGASFDLTDQLTIPANNANHTLTIRSDNSQRTLTRAATTGNLFSLGLVNNLHLIFENIVICGNNVGVSMGAAVHINNANARLTMNDGAIVRNHRRTGSTAGVAIRLEAGEFTMNGGEIRNNTANQSGGGVLVAGANAIFTMNGGLITGNSAAGTNTDEGGGGILLNTGGTVIINGGSITNNTAAANSQGAGVYVVNGTLTIGGNAIIENNTRDGAANNVVLNAGRYITLATGTNAPTPQMNVGITKTADNGVFVESGANAGHADNFFADNSTWSITHDNGQLVLSPPPSPVSVSGFTTGDPTRGFDNLTDAFASITTAGSGTYTVTLFENQTMTAGRTFSTDNTNITLTGGSTMRTITHNITETAPSMFTISGATTSFTLGDNITVQGRTAGGGGAVVNMTAGTFNMQGNSRIQGHNVSGVPSGAVLMAGTTAFNMSGTSVITGITSTTATSAAVYVTNAGAIFTMSGGSSITGNTNTLATAVSDVGAGLTVINGQFNMNGGSITSNRRGAIGDNTAPYADVYIGAATFAAVDLVPTLNNNAQIGTLTLNGVSNNTRINIGNDFNGNVQALNLRWNDNNMATVISRWTASSVVVLAGNFAPHLPMFNSALALGQFVSQTNDREAIAPRVFNSSGGLQ
jgi:hypothetical protein